MNRPETPDSDLSGIAQPLGDPLGEILHLLKPTGTFYCQARLSAPWGVAIPPMEGVLSFVLAASGSGWLTVGDTPPLRLEQGDFVLLSGGAAHRLQSDPDAPVVGLDALPVRRVTEIYETLEHGGGGAVSDILYGVVRIDHVASGILMALLPDVLKVDAWAEESGGWLQASLQFVAREARALRPGGQGVVTRLSDVVIIEAIRRWIATAPEADQGWLRGARDPQIGRAIIAVHRTPADDWTLERLAGVAGMSRSAFSARFTRLIGQSAMQYVATWRMHLARARLLETAEPLSAIAADLGYQSEPAFSRAFKRVFRETPGRVRQKGRAGAGLAEIDA